MKIRIESNVPAGMFCNGCKYLGVKYADCTECIAFGRAVYYEDVDHNRRTVKCNNCLNECARLLRKY